MSGSKRGFNGPDAKVSLEVKADFKRGSFDVNLHLIVSAFEQFRSMLMGGPKDAKEILEVLGFYGVTGTAVTKGVIALAKRIKRGRITEATSLGDGTTRIVIEHRHTLAFESFVAEDRALELIRRYSVAKALESVVDPLSKNGVDVFQVKNKGIVEAAISKDDASAFLTVMPDVIDGEKLSDNTLDTPFEVATATASSSPEYIWRLSDGSGVINVHIKDKQFFSDIQRGVKTISLGDTLFVTIRSVTISRTVG